MSSSELEPKQARLLRRVAVNLRAGRDELATISDHLSGEERERLLRYIQKLEGCLQRVNALADKVTLYGDPGTPEADAEFAELRREINGVLRDVLAVSRALEALSEEPDEAVN